MHVQVLMIGHLVGFDLIGAETVFFKRILVRIPMRTGQLIHATVRTRIHDVMLDMDRLPFFRTDKVHGMVAVLKFDGIVFQSISSA